MNSTIILHHYENSPYAEKIRLMFGMTELPWCSLLSPVWPPRPNVDPLTGGYRRIPVAQIGADIFCDTALIAQEVAALSNNRALTCSDLESSALELMHQAETETFFAAIGAVPPHRLLWTMLQQFGPIGTYRFVKDRSGLLKGGTLKSPAAADAKPLLQDLLGKLEEQLKTQPWINGDSASIADLTVYHPLWLHKNCNRDSLDCGPQVRQWFGAVEKLGHGQRQEITQADAFDAAKTDPRPLPESIDAPVTLGSNVEVAPQDYGVTPVAGTLAAITDERIIVARETEQFGLLHVHFPNNAYAITPC